MRRATTKPAADFLLGRVGATPGVLDAVSMEELRSLLRRHAAGDWGDCTPEDAAENDRALVNGARLLSVYETAGGTVWLITEADRSATTALLPSEY